MRVVFVDDDRAVVRAIEMSARGESDIDLLTTTDPAVAKRTVLHEDIDALVTDERMGSVRGTRLLAEIAEAKPAVARILVTGVGDMAIAEYATCVSGVHALLRKPIAGTILWREVRAGIVRAKQEAQMRWIEQVFSPPPPPRESTAIAQLTFREREVVRLLVSGHSVKVIAGALGVHEETVRSHRKALYKKLSVHSRSELFQECRGWEGVSLPPPKIPRSGDG